MPTTTTERLTKFYTENGGGHETAAAVREILAHLRPTRDGDVTCWTLEDGRCVSMVGGASDYDCPRCGRWESGCGHRRVQRLCNWDDLTSEEREALPYTEDEVAELTGVTSDGRRATDGASGYTSLMRCVGCGGLHIDPAHGSSSETGLWLDGDGWRCVTCVVRRAVAAADLDRDSQRVLWSACDEHDERAVVEDAQAIAADPVELAGYRNGWHGCELAACTQQHLRTVMPRADSVIPGVRWVEGEQVWSSETVDCCAHCRAAWEDEHGSVDDALAEAKAAEAARDAAREVES